MRLLLVVCVTLTVSAVPVFGQAGSIGIFGDPSGTDCNLLDVPGALDYYVVHVGTPGATGAQFYAPQPACLQATYLATTCVGITLNCDAQSLVSVGYGGCFAGPVPMATIHYFGVGSTGPCCYYPVLPSPLVASGQIEVTDCNDNVLFATGGEGIVNPVPGCMCDVPASPSTWGKVKALYVE